MHSQAWSRPRTGMVIALVMTMIDTVTHGDIVTCHAFDIVDIVMILTRPHVQSILPKHKKARWWGSRGTWHGGGGRRRVAAMERFLLI